MITDVQPIPPRSKQKEDWVPPEARPRRTARAGSDGSDGGGRAGERAASAGKNGVDADRLERIDKRLRQIEARLTSLESAAPRNGGTAKRPQAKRGAAGGRRSRGKRDLNAVSFEDLRELGLSVTASAKVVAARETRGGFRSLDEIAELNGVPQASIDTIRSKLTV